MTETSPLEHLLKNDRAVVIAALAAVIIASWLHLLDGAGTGMSTLAMTSWKMALGIAGPMTVPVAWSVHYAWLMFAMWWVMMIAMMLPSAAPMILLHARINRTSSTRSGTPFDLWPTTIFTLGYLLAWAVFSAIATGLQWAFEALGVLSPMMMNSTNQIFAGFILLFAGVYQLTPLKQACLRYCRGPLGFLTQHWRLGRSGALMMGLHHGSYCLGCCWGLMAILFFGGIMNLYWIIGLALLVLIEKTLPVGPVLSYVTGAIFATWGAALMVIQAVS